MQDKRFSRRDILFGGLRKLRAFGEEKEPAPAAKAAPPASELAQRLAAGHAAFNRADYPAATEEYQACIRLDPNHPDVRRRLGYCLYRQARYVQAKVELERALRILGKDNYASLYLGLTLARMDRPADAVSAWRAYYNPDEIRIMRELNLQIALLEAPEPTTAEAAADAVDEAVELRKEELREAKG
ncbi:MAG: tetratricopeptide repeat protein [Thermodesulfobacteriota bacterium]